VSGALIMALVATIAGALGLVAVLGHPRTEAAVYGRRIAGTMLIAFAVVLYGYAWALHRWSAGG
jgi:hypothetical protein